VIYDWVGLAVCLVGGFCQVALARRFRWNLPLTWAVVAIAFSVQIIIRESPLPSLTIVSSFWFYWLPAAIQCWFLCLTFAFLVLLLGDRIRPLLDSRHIRGSLGVRGSRRGFLRTLGTAACAAPPTALLFGIVTRNEFEVNEQALAVPHLPDDLKGLRIVHLSDPHVGAFFSLRQWERAIAAANEFRPDLAMVTGDLITTERDPLEECIQSLAKLRTTAGIFGCHGNHEYFSGVQDRATRLGAESGIRFLRRQAAELRFGKHSINLVGVDYQRFRRPYLEGVEDLVSSGDLNILLSHNPDVFPAAAGQGFDLVFSGHTHGGQVNVEILHKQLDIARFFTPYVKGLYREAASSVYVSAGLGTIGIPVRLGAKAEVTLHTLCAS
jgi:predicted MPP superfamily phosphohydrolase